MNAQTRRALVAKLEQGKSQRVFTPTEVAMIFLVCTKTVSRWVDAGLIACTRTKGGHRRFSAADIWAALQTEEDLVLPHQVATLFRVEVKTVERWKLPSIRTPGNHIRLLKSGVDRYLRNPEATDKRRVTPPS